MTQSLEARIAETRRLAESGRLDEATATADDVVAQYPTESKSWALRAHLRTLAEDYAGANADLDTASRLRPDEPYYFFRRGLNSLVIGDWHSALLDLTTGMKLRDPAYEEAFRFARAEALIELGRKREARRDLETLPDNIRMWTSRLRTKEDLLSACQASPP